jgi:hypothetical protein
MKYKLPVILLFAIFALPLPLSLMSWIGTVISISAAFEPGGPILVKWAAVTTMLLAGTYAVSYMYSLKRTLKVNKIIHISLLPLLHMVAFVLFYGLWAALGE